MQCCGAANGLNIDCQSSWAIAKDLDDADQAFRNALDPILDEFGLHTPMLGYTPAACARDLELVPKFRYECMTDFLGAQAYDGICMIRGSAALQISIDYENEADAMPAPMVELDENNLLAKCVGATRLGVNTIHHQGIDELGEGLVVNAISPDDGIIEGIEMQGKRFIVDVQWHPEHMWRRRPHSKRLFRALVEAAATSQGVHGRPTPEA